MSDTHYVTLTPSQILMLRYLNKVGLDRQLSSLYYNTRHLSEYEAVRETVVFMDSFLDLDDVFEKAIKTINDGGHTSMDFRLPPTTHAYLLGLADRYWSPHDLIIPDGLLERENICNRVNETLPDLALALKAKSPVQVVPNTPTPSMAS